MLLPGQILQRLEPLLRTEAQTVDFWVEVNDGCHQQVGLGTQTFADRINHRLRDAWRHVNKRLKRRPYRVAQGLVVDDSECPRPAHMPPTACDTHDLPP